MKAVVIGSSTGGPEALQYILSRLPGDFRAVVIVLQHLPKQFTASMAKRMDAHTPLQMQEVMSEQYLKEGNVYVVPGDRNFFVKHDERGSDRAHLLVAEVHPKPSIDMGFTSVAEHFVEETIGVVLTGMGADGVRGAEAIRKAGGIVIAQDEASSAVYGMPGAIAEKELAQYVLPLEDIPGHLMTLVQ